MHYCVLVGDERPYFTNELIKSGCIHTKEVMITEQSQFLHKLIIYPLLWSISYPITHPHFPISSPSASSGYYNSHNHSNTPINASEDKSAILMGQSVHINMLFHVCATCCSKSCSVYNGLNSYYILLHTTYTMVTPMHFLTWHAM